jgi:hypothetical protein
MRPVSAALVLGASIGALVLASGAAAAHGLAEGDKEFIVNNPGAHVVPFLYLGAKHMATGYDHLLFLVGVVFFLYKLRDVAIYVSMFTLGHSATLLLGVFADLQVSAYLIDAIIGLSVVYKGFDNLGGFQRLLGFQPNTKAAVLVFGLFHGFGLATKLQEFDLPAKGLVTNILSFNLGVEIGQFLALGVILIFLSWWRTLSSFDRGAFATNTLLMAGGFVLTGYQLAGYILGGAS